MAYGRIQGNAGTTRFVTLTTGNSTSLTAQPSNGNLLIAYIVNNTNANSPLTVVDGASNPFTLLSTWSVRGTALSCGIYGKIAGAAQGRFVTATWSVACTFDIGMEEWAGGPATLTGIVDGTAPAGGNNTTGTSSSGSQPSQATTGPHSLGLSLLAQTAGSAFTGETWNGSSITSGMTVNGNVGLAAYQANLNGVTPWNPVFTWTTSHAWCQASVALVEKPPGLWVPSVF